VTQVAHDPVEAGADQSDAPKEAAAPDASRPAATDSGAARAVPAAGPAKDAPAKDDAPADAPREPDPIPTGFPEPVSAEPEREPSPDGMVRLVPVGFGHLTVPPLELGGESVVITAEGTDCDEETAARAHEAAHLAGFRLREV
jgi:hypothetical protein